MPPDGPVFYAAIESIERSGVPEVKNRKLQVELVKSLLLPEKEACVERLQTLESQLAVSR